MRGKRRSVDIYNGDVSESWKLIGEMYLGSYGVYLPRRGSRGEFEDGDRAETRDDAIENNFQRLSRETFCKY